MSGTICSTKQQMSIFIQHDRDLSFGVAVPALLGLGGGGGLGLRRLVNKEVREWTVLCRMSKGMNDALLGRSCY